LGDGSEKQSGETAVAREPTTSMSWLLAVTKSTLAA